MDFHAAGGDPDVRERLLMAGNQCISPWTFVQTQGAQIQSAIAFSSADARVVSLADESECDSSAQNGMLRNIEPAYRFVMESGLFFDSSAEHQVATEQGWMQMSQLMLHANGLHYSQKREGYQASCVEGGYLCDPQLLLEADSGLGILPLQADARNSSLTFSQKDAAERTLLCTNTFQRYDLLTISENGALLHEALYGQFAAAYVSQSVLSLKDSNLEYLQSQIELNPVLLAQESDYDLFVLTCANLNLQKELLNQKDKSELLNEERRWYLQSSDEKNLGCSLKELHHNDHDISVFYSLHHPKLIGGERILAVIPIGYQPIIDIQVPDLHNYKAGGAYHHNCGKTWSAAFETAVHLTGQYPDWWEGTVFDAPTTGWAASLTSQSTRDTVQRLLLGQPGQWGTGAIPKASILDIKRAAHGVADAVETIMVKWGHSGQSRITIKTYDQGRERWQGETLDFVWFDEEPPQDIYTEGLTRTNATGGIVWITFTPLLGMSSVVKRFIVDKVEGTHVTTMTIDDAEHYTPEERRKIINSYPAHERDARAKGIPTLGSGRVFPIDENDIKEPTIVIPEHWPRLAALDFGWDHPTAMVWGAWDRDTDTVHIYDAHRAKETTPIIHSATLMAKGKWIPVAWPHDGLQHDKGSGEALAQQYRNLGVNMLKEKASHPPIAGEEEGTGGNSVEAGLMDMLQRMQTGRLKVAEHLNDWFEEFRLYHRKDGKLVKVDEDLLSATRYLIMMIRFAKINTPKRTSQGTGFVPLDREMGY